MNAEIAYESLRPDLAAICDWIRHGARILDLGCGNGTLLSYLKQSRRVRGYGLEIDPVKVAACIERGVNVLQADIDMGLRDFRTGAFDYVIMTHALQALARPDIAIEEMLRVGREAIVTFPNFGHWRVRAALAAGHMPITPALPSEWYDTPNIHLCTMADFESLCRQRNWRIAERLLLDRKRRQGWGQKLVPNLFTEIALYRLSGERQAVR